MVSGHQCNGIRDYILCSGPYLEGQGELYMQMTITKEKIINSKVVPKIQQNYIRDETTKILAQKYNFKIPRIIVVCCKTNWKPGKKTQKKILESRKRTENFLHLF